jgi:hypothetical protein
MPTTVHETYTECNILWRIKISCSHGGMMARCSLVEVYQHFAPKNGLFKDPDSFTLPCSYRFTQGSYPCL